MIVTRVTPDPSLQHTQRSEVESAYAWTRLGVSLLIGTIGAVGLWSAVVVLPAVQAEFAVARADASLPYTLSMVGLAFGGVMMGRLTDRFGMVWPIVGAGFALGLGYVASGFATSLWQFTLAHGLFIGFLGTSAMFVPLMADISRWFTRRRGVAVAIAAVGNYLAGTVWPPIVQHFVVTAGWRATHIGIGLFCIATIVPLAILLRRPVPTHDLRAAESASTSARDELGLSPNVLQGILIVAGFACCVAMAMPQVHIVAYCGDLGYGVARGAEMLSLMLGFGIISRVASGWIADRIGGLRTLLLGSTLQGIALFFYLLFDGLTSLYVISALFGLFQGGIVPSYAIIIREYFSPFEAGARVGVVIMATLFGMAFGGWLSGMIFDLAGSYHAAFASGLAANLLNTSIAAWLISRTVSRPRLASI